MYKWRRYLTFQPYKKKELQKFELRKFQKRQNYRKGHIFEKIAKKKLKSQDPKNKIF